MKKDDLEYQSGQEYAPLPDEYLQGGGNIVPPAEKRRPVWKKMIYMAAAFALMADVAFQPGGGRSAGYTGNGDGTGGDEGTRSHAGG